MPDSHRFLFLLFGVHPISWDIGALPDSFKFLLSLVIVHRNPWDQVAHGHCSDIPSAGQMTPIFTLGAPSSSHLLGPSSDPSQTVANLHFGWSEFILLPGTSSDPSQSSAHFSVCLGWSEFIPPPGTSSDPSRIFTDFCWGWCGPSSSHLSGPGRTPPASSQIFTPSLDPSEVSLIFTLGGRSSSRLLGPAQRGSDPSQTVANLHFGWSEFIPPPGTSSDPSQSSAHFCFCPGWSEFIPPPGTSSDPFKIFTDFCWGWCGPSSSHLPGPTRTLPHLYRFLLPAWTPPKFS